MSTACLMASSRVLRRVTPSALLNRVSNNPRMPISYVPSTKPSQPSMYYRQVTEANRAARHVGAFDYLAFSTWRASHNKLSFKQQVHKYFKVRE